MSRKNLILTAVIVVMFGGTAIVLYRGFVSRPAPVSNSSVVPSAVPLGGTSQGTPVASNPTATAAAHTTTETAKAPAVPTISSARILPLGAAFDTTAVKKYNPDRQLFSYPTVNDEEVGPVNSPQPTQVP